MESLQAMFEWHLESKPIPQSDIPYFNLHYLYGCKTPADPTIAWGTELDVSGMQAFLRERNETSKILLSPAHVLLQAVGRSLAEFPQLNTRVVGNSIYPFKETNVRTMIFNKSLGEVDVVLLKQANEVSLERLAKLMWKYQRQAAKSDTQTHTDRQMQQQRWPRWLLSSVVKTYFWLDRNFRLPKRRFDRISNAPVLVNYLGFPGAPSMRMYKPSRFPDESSHLSVTMGKIEKRPVVVRNEIVIRPIAPIFVRMDHRIANAYVLANFMSHLGKLINDPTQMEKQEAPHVATPAIQKAA